MKKVFALILVLFMTVSGFAIELNVKVSPGAFFPFLSAGATKYAVAGGGTFIDTGITLFNYLNVGPEFGVEFLPKNNSGALEEGKDPLAIIVPVAPV